MPVHDHIIKAMSLQQVTCPTLLDLTAAFGTIDRSILLERLSSWFGITSNALSWITSRDVLDSNFDRIPETGYHQIVDDRIRPDIGFGYRIRIPNAKNQCCCVPTLFWSSKPVSWCSERYWFTRLLFIRKTVTNWKLNLNCPYILVHYELSLLRDIYSATHSSWIMN